jgi:hypothetical protein
LFDINLDRLINNEKTTETNLKNNSKTPLAKVANNLTLDGDFNHRPINPEGLSELLLFDISDEAHAKLEQLNRIMI